MKNAGNKKANTRGDQRQSGCQKTKHGGEEPSFLRNDFSGSNWRLIEVHFRRLAGYGFRRILQAT